MTVGSNGLGGIGCRGTWQASDENRVLGSALQNYKQESDSQLLRAQRLADEQRHSIDTLQRQNQYLTEEMRYKEEQISKQVPFSTPLPMPLPWQPCAGANMEPWPCRERGDC